MQGAKTVAMMVLMGAAGMAGASSAEGAVGAAPQPEQSLMYERGATSSFPGGQRRQFTLQSQRWPDRQQGPAWRHRVEVLLPDAPQPGPALLVINNGVAHDGGGRPAGTATDLPAEVLETLVRTLGMAVVSLADVPPQAMALPGDTVLRTEDDLVAVTWRRYLDDPARPAHWPLHVPMTEAAVRALDLADRELPAVQRPSYIVTGASKRGWITWLLPLVDERVSHLAPFVIDMHWQALAPHIRSVHAGRWPIALQPYVDHGITAEIDTDGFADLMRIVDPYTHLDGPRAARLALPKLLVNASGDDFFPPDATSHYLPALQGPTALRMAPNSDHGGIRRFTANALLPTLRRWRTGRGLPQIDSQWSAEEGRLQVRAQGERPRRALLWQAHNPHARDFRHACGITYQSAELELNDQGGVSPPLAVPTRGWSASFVELHYDDGMVVTTPVQVLPQERFPAQPPAQGEGRCRLVPLSGSAPPAQAVATMPAVPATALQHSAAAAPPSPVD